MCFKLQRNIGHGEFVSSWPDVKDIIETIIVALNAIIDFALISSSLFAPRVVAQAIIRKSTVRIAYMERGQQQLYPGEKAKSPHRLPAIRGFIAGDPTGIRTPVFRSKI